jgi:hypothetical protein
VPPLRDAVLQELDQWIDMREPDQIDMAAAIDLGLSDLQSPLARPREAIS